MIQIEVPGSKSITNRAMILASLARGKSILKNYLESDDTLALLTALKKLGVKIIRRGAILQIAGGNVKKIKSILYTGNSGTAMRFLAAVLAAQPFSSTLDGDKRMRKRPIGDLLQALKELGPRAKSKNGYPPVRVHGPILGGKCAVNGNISSQFLSALLCAAPLAKNDVEIRVKGNLASKPYIDLTVDLLKKFGIKVRRNGCKTFRIKAGQRFMPRKIAIEGDASSAGYFWGISALTGENFDVKNVPPNSLQPDIKFKNAIYKLAAGVKKIDCNCFPDSAMTLAVLAAFYPRALELSGLSNLRVKESDRLHALAVNLNRIGAKAVETRDGLKIYGNPNGLKAAHIKTYSDHRIAMCFGMAGFAIPGMKIENPGCVSKTYPAFWRDIAILKQRFLEKNIVLTGMRFSGKSELGRLIAKKLGRKFIDTDELIRRKTKMPIAKIIAKKGWGYFRRMEKTVVKRAAALKHSVISTGGGIVTDKNNMLELRRNGKIIFLDIGVRALKKRAEESPYRPALTRKKNFMSEQIKLYAARLPLYRKNADKVIDVSKHTNDKKRDFKEKIKTLERIIARLGLI